MEFALSHLQTQKKVLIKLRPRKIFLIHITNAPRDCPEETSLNIYLI